jgi:preprotein translocase subunit SecD
MQNQYSLWKYILLIAMIILGLIYAAPNFFGEDYAVQISGKNSAQVNDATINQVKQTLDKEKIPYLSMEKEGDSELIRFANTDIQIKARDTIKAVLGDNYSVVINLVPRTPHWLSALGAQPVKLGLDLRGGINFLLDVDVNSVIQARLEGEISNIVSLLRDKNIRYTNIHFEKPQSIVIEFRDSQNLNDAKSALSGSFPDYIFTSSENNGYVLKATLSQMALTNMTNYAVEQNRTTLSNRVNELGVSEAVVQRQGEHQISVELPGIQDIARAKDIIGKTATLKLQLVDIDNDARTAASSGVVPLGDTLYQFEGLPILLKNQVILRGDSITYATASTGQDGRPAVNVRLGGGGENLFARATAENVGKPLSVVYVETIPQTRMVDGKPVITHQQVEKVINVATIQSALSNNFEITGLSDPKYAQNLALLLRSGALTASVAFLQERTIGPSLGAANIKKGVMSLVVGTLLVVIFMAAYYRLFGLIADLALVLNIVFILAILSILGATLTLPGLAGVVLTVGMAVDANVLINERIREELRNGMSPQASIRAGYERAFATIVDANVTTLIVTIILFALGSGPVKNFAITLAIGILTSMVTANFFTRAIVNLIYGGRNVKGLSIGIKPRKETAAEMR